VIGQLRQYKNASVTWAQEEPKNAGGWTYAQPRMRNINKYLGKTGKDVKIDYAGRPIAAATAVGFAHVHKAQLANLIDDTFKQ